MSGKTVLIADDDSAIRTVLSQALTRAGYSVRSTATAAALWRWVSEGQGDAVVCVHFIEHIDDPGTLSRWLGRKLTPGGRAYVEWPSPHSLDLPARQTLEDNGVELIISRFDDDDTHQRLPRMEEIIESMRSAGLRIETQGTVRLPWLEDEMMAGAVDDAFNRQAAFWSATGWSQYLIVNRPFQGN